MATLDSGFSGYGAYSIKLICVKCICIELDLTVKKSVL